ncbi:MAG: hypothetical protein M1828_006124 [Chrysothrix sp. TS-e1954]|nr:MAG: hypothetical protein M1828_006124 [Chrysothrix sp. TS-e1954]
MFDVIPNTLSLLLTTLLPLYLTHKSLSYASTTSSNATCLAPWLTYYALASLIPAIELLTPLITYLPLYAWARLGVHLYLLLPGDGQGAGYVYSAHVAPFLGEHERGIEDAIGVVRRYVGNNGWAYVQAAVEFVRETLLGYPSSTTQSPQGDSPRGSTAGSSYLESVRAWLTTPPPASSAGAVGRGRGVDEPAAPKSVYELLTGLFAATAAGNLNTTSANDVTSTDPSTRLNEIRAQRQRLTTLLSAFEAEEAQLKGLNLQSTSTRDPTTSNPPTNGDVDINVRKSKSETDFERIDSDDVPSTPMSGSGASTKLSREAGKGKGWGEWMFGSGKGKTAGKDKDV